MWTLNCLQKKSLTVTHWTLCNNNHQRKTNLQCHLHQEKNDKKINSTFIHITFVSNHKKVSLYKNLDIKISTNDKKWKGTSWKLKSLLLFIVLKKDFLFILFTLFNFLSLHLTQLTQSFPVTSNWLSHISIVQKWLNENSFARKMWMERYKIFFHVTQDSADKDDPTIKSTWE